MAVELLACLHLFAGFARVVVDSFIVVFLWQVIGGFYMLQGVRYSVSPSLSYISMSEVPLHDGLDTYFYFVENLLIHCLGSF